MRPVLLSCGYVVILFALLSGWWLVAGAAVVLVSWWGSAVPLVVVGLLVDGYFGWFGAVPVHTISALVWCIVVEGLRPLIREQ